MTKRVNHTPAERRGVNGFTLLELITAVAVLGILVAMAIPSIVNMLQRQETKTSATQMAGLLSDARARAVSEGTPHLVYFNPPTVNGDGQCGAAAIEVRDADHSYSITDGDDTREFHLSSDACRKVKPLGEDAPADLTAAMPMPIEDLAVRAPDASAAGAVTTRASSAVASAAESESSNSGSGNSGSNGNSGSGSSGSNSGSGNANSPAAVAATTPAAVEGLAVRSSKVADTVVNGATFPVDVGSGRPVIAFSERGIPVDPADPNALGSGAGGIYLTDGGSVFVALVAPLGEVKLRAYDSASQSWK